MRCHEIRSWTFKGLVAAFLDLSVAFSLLCASVIVYLTSKFLGLFGLNLPCPCDGLFSETHKNKCFQETLKNLPVKKITSVQRCVKNKTPFDSILCKEANGDCVGKKRKEGEHSRHVDVFSSPPFVEEVDSWVEKNASGFDLLNSQSRKKGSFKIKSKRLSFYKSPYGIKNHFQGSKNFQQQSPSSVVEYFNDVDENNPLLVNSKDGEKALEDVSLRKSVSLSSVGSEACTQSKQPERTFSWAGEGTCSSPLDLTYSGMTQKTIEILEQVLAEERAARARLAIELEKERNAAASAADEALSMILRLQEDKASIEMEAKQYQRMIEEKSAFDAEEMSILKEILLRREREKHYLEKEVDSYRQMFLDTEQHLPNTPERSEMPQQMTEPLDYMETADVSSGFEIFTNQMDSRLVAFGNKSVLPGDYDNTDSTKPEEIAKLKEREEHRSSFTEPVSRSSNNSDSKKLSEDSHNIDSPVHDIHVVTNGDNKIQLHVPSDYTTRDLKLDRSQSVSDTSYGLPPTCRQGQRNLSPIMRRNSMSAVDYERLKIESEVGLLRGRLRAVQKGREKISFSSKEQTKTSRFKETRRSGPLDSSSPSSTMVKAMSMSLDLHSA
ncbi:Myosin-binding protein 3 [Cardamine amara subsp. amara]|uniref:Myosin-binding protein 3 n=1 Tax=Cardamine amara subsp. amara TaxID=228776 RepID=A0ABD0ZIA1_CARAN